MLIFTNNVTNIIKKAKMLTCALKAHVKELIIVIYALKVVQSTF